MGNRILVADDSVTIQKAFAMVFGGQDVSLQGARSFDEAMELARKSRPDVVIADSALGNRTGYDLCSAIKQDWALRSVPVYILASSHVPFDEARGKQAGADGHLSKPFESQAMVDRVMGILATQAPAVAALADDDDSYGELTIERAADFDVPPIPERTPVPVTLTRSTPAPAPMLRPSLIPGFDPGAFAAKPPRTVTPVPTPIPEVATLRMPVLVPAPVPAPIPAAMTLRFPTPVLAPSPGTPIVPPVPLSRTPPPVTVALARPPVDVASIVDRKIEEISVRGPEYAAIVKLSREIIEQVVWEVVPELAEAIIRREVEKLAKK